MIFVAFGRKRGKILGNLSEAIPHKTYQVTAVPEHAEVKKHLQDLGLIPGSQVILLKTQGANGIVLLHKSRLALDQSVLQQIQVKEVTSQTEVLPLSDLAVGDQGKVVSIFGEGAVRRRLMDMGLTKNVQVAVRKLAPLGDPVELSLRGYALSLRKSEAEYILVEKEVTP